MAVTVIKAEKVVRTALGLLEREIVLPRMVWRDAGGDFAGARGDTITVKVPAYTNARTRTLRAATPVTLDALAETSVAVTLTTDVYKAVPITDEELTLDIVDFGMQVLEPCVSSVARGCEDLLAAEMSGSSPEVELELDADDPYQTLLLARQALNDARVPMGGRGFACGSSIETALLGSDHLSKVDESGSDDALREARIGRVAGFTVVSVPGLPPDEAYAFHRTAFVLSLKAPVVPAGASWGASQSFANLAMRALRDYDFTNTQDRLLVDTFVGTNIVEDHGALNSDGQFVPADDPDTDDGTDLVFVRAVKITSGS